MNVLILDGFEYVVTAFLPSGSGSRAIVDGELKLSPTGGAAASVGWDMSLVGHLHAGVRVGVSTLPASDVVLFDVSDFGGGFAIGLRYDTATGKLKPFCWTGGSFTDGVPSGPVLVAGQRYFIKFDLDDHGGGGTTFDYTVDGVAQPTFTHSTDGSTRIFIAGNYHGPTEALDIFVDDLLVVSGGGVSPPAHPLAYTNIIAARPGSMGASVNPTDFEHEDATPIDGDTWMRLTEVFGSTSENVKQTVSDASGYVEVLNAPLVDVTAVLAGATYVEFHTANGAFVTTGQLIVRNPDTGHESTLSLIAVGDGGGEPRYSSIGNPDQGALTVADALLYRFGYSTDLVQAVDALLVQWALTEVVPRPDEHWSVHHTYNDHTIGRG